jgi:hypothetical protein
MIKFEDKYNILNISYSWIEGNNLSQFIYIIYRR